VLVAGSGVLGYRAYDQGVFVFGARFGHGLRFIVLVVAALPFARLTWWSVAVPMIGVLLLALAWPATRTHPSPIERA
jgi:hypothetical protein